MKKLIPVLIIVLLLSACNFPGEVDYSQDPVVQTSVSMILTKGAQTQQIAPLDQTTTPLPVQTETPPVETQTQEATATLIQTTETEPAPSQTPSPLRLSQRIPGRRSHLHKDFDSGDYWISRVIMCTPRSRWST